VIARRRRSKVDRKIQNLSLFIASICIGAGTLAFGGDSPAVIFLLSLIIFCGVGGVGFLSYKLPSTTSLLFEDGLFLFMSTCVIGLVIADYSNGLFWSFEHEYLFFFALIGLFWLGCKVGKTRMGLQKATTVILIFAGAYSLYSILQQIFAPGTILGFEKSYHQARLSGTFLSANTAATIFGVFVFFGLASLYEAWTDWHSKRLLIERVGFQIVITGLSLWCLAATASLAGVAMFILALIGVLICGAIYRLTLRSGKRDAGKLQGTSSDFMLWDRFNIFAVIWLGISLIGVLIFFFILAGIFPFNGERLQTAFTERRFLYGVLWDAFLESPFTGHGLGRVDSIKLKHLQIEGNYFVTGQRAAHNVLLQWLVQSGVFFTLIAMGLFAFLFNFIAGGLRRVRYNWSYLLAIIASITFLMLHSLFDYAVEIPAIAMIGTWLVGLGLGYEINARGRPQKSS